MHKSWNIDQDIEAIGSLVAQLQDPTWMDVFLNKLSSVIGKKSDLKSDSSLSVATQRQITPPSERIDKLINNYKIFKWSCVQWCSISIRIGFPLI